MPFQVLPQVPVHPTEELLEEYSFGRVGEPALTPLEEHLLVCVPCQSKLEELEDCAAILKTALAAWELSRETARARTFPWLTWPKIPAANAILAAACMTIFVTAIIAWHPPSHFPAATVKLAAMRGGNAGSGSSGGLAQAPSGRPLVLAIDGSNLPASPGYRLAVVNQSGREIWSGAATVEGTKLSVHIVAGYGPGVYWVRLYSSSGAFLREFGMHLE